MADTDRSRRAVDKQWRGLLDEIEYLLKVLTSNGDKARKRLSAPVAFDGYPASSMPESSIASGRVGNPTLATVVRHAGGRKDPNTGQDTKDTWNPPYDPVGVSVNRMKSQTLDGFNRLCSALDAALPDPSLKEWVEQDRTWPELLEAAIAVVGWLREDDRPRDYVTSQCLDGRNRFRTAVSAMHDALPKGLPDAEREQCQTCGTLKAVVTGHGKKPRQWVAGESKCRECVERPRRVARGRAS